MYCALQQDFLMRNRTDTQSQKGASRLLHGNMISLLEDVSRVISQQYFILSRFYLLCEDRNYLEFPPGAFRPSQSHNDLIAPPLTIRTGTEPLQLKPIALRRGASSPILGYHRRSLSSIMIAGACMRALAPPA